MSAQSQINWLRSKAKKLPDDTMSISEDEAKEAGCLPGTYRIEFWSFEGVIPHRMMSALLRREKDDLENTEYVHESLRLGNGYVSGRNICAFYRTVYTRIASEQSAQIAA
jgi:hypothetical protein